MGCKSELFFRTLAEHSMGPVVGTDREGRVLFWSSGAAELFALSREDVAGQSFFETLRSGGNTSLLRLETCFDAGSGAWAEEAISGASEKEGFPLSTEASLFEVAEEGELCYYCVFKRSKLSLESRLNKLNTELKEFAYIISHDLKAPLRAVTILSEWILTDYYDKFDEDGQERIKLLVGRAKKIQSMIDGVLQYSRIGRSGEEAEEVDVNEVVAELSEKIESIKGDRIFVEKKLPKVSFDLIRLRQVFYNLLINAVESSEEGGEIRVDCKESPGYFTFSVSDKGRGVEEKNVKRIFNIFQTLSSNDDPDRRGIGLTLVKRIVEMSEGEVWVESELGRGSTFFFTLIK